MKTKLPLAASAPRGVGMSAAILRLLTITSLVLMSLGMGSVAAAHAPAVDSASRECADHPQGSGSTDSRDQASPLCSMTCTALPAGPGNAVPPPPLVSKPATFAALPGLAGIILEIATPPPRLA